MRISDVSLQLSQRLRIGDSSSLKPETISGLQKLNAKVCGGLADRYSVTSSVASVTLIDAGPG